MRDLTGRKVIGFAFEDKVHCDLQYNLRMNSYIGQTGTIVGYRSSRDGYLVEFDDKEEWVYPAKLIEPYLLHPFPYITTSTPMLCSDNEKQWLRDEILCQLPDGTYLSKDLYTWKYVKPLNETV